MNTLSIFASSCVLLLALTGCMSTQEHKAAVSDNSANRVTVGVVQKEIKFGMRGGDVAAVLGSPNIVSTDENRNEVWIYDKISTEYAHSSSSGGISSLILGFGSEVLAGVGGSYNYKAGASSRSQRTLTIIIKFNKNGVVRDFAYHTSRF
ncbi:hypothetical protein [Thalassotalea sp. ND16A]|uniref:hypothetical protein n=1 Tax=Thalassotalea sp. ND16A TaxID=1535422 RepID=UPI00051A3590|nr:hypothetical protein [Thalassotalea sp. ND16A]KGK01535.1 hypothetical protein ND16A_2989 [Thalassotalea sp. ND16A]